MTYEEYKEEKQKKETQTMHRFVCDEYRFNGTDNDRKFIIRNDDDYKTAKEAIEKYEEDNFNLTYEDFEKIDKCFQEQIESLTYKETSDDESYLERIVKVMRFLDWNYAFNKNDEITCNDLLNTLEDIFKDAMNGVVKYKTKNYYISTGGWTLKVDFEKYQVLVYFSLFDEWVSYDDIENGYDLSDYHVR